VSSSKRPTSKAAKAAAPRRPPTGPPASARLTIKAGPPGRPGQVDLPPRPRPGGRRPLSEVVLEEDEVLTDSFDATLNGVQVRVTAVLERTCVYLGLEGERTLVSKKDLLVEADKLPIRRRGMP